MKFSCEKSQLLSAVTVSSRATAVKSAVQSLEGLLLEVYDTVVISGYDLKTGIKSEIRADISETGSIILNARLFGEIIRKLPDDIVTLSADSNCMMNIKCGMSEFNIMGSPADDYPELPGVEGQSAIVIKQKYLKSIISETNFAVSDNEARPIHTGALFEMENGILTVVAVDGYRLALRREAVEGMENMEISFVVPGSALAEVERITSADSEEKVRIVVGLKHIMFITGSTVLISRKLEGEFLNYKNSIPKTGKYSIEIRKSDFISSVERVSLIISDKFKSPVRCIFGDGVLKVSTNTTLGRATDECPINGDGEGLEIGFNNRYILEALKAAPAENVRLQLSTGISPCIIVPTDESKNFIYMILPVRLRANEG